MSAKVYRKGEDVTDEYTATAFNWTRISGDESADASWNAAHSGMKSITVSANELTEDIQIQCTLTGTAPSYGSVDVNDSFIASHTRGVADSNDTLSLEDGTLFVTTDDDNYRLSGNELTALYPRLNGSVTANAWVYHTQPLKTIEFKYNSSGLRVQKKVTANGKSETTDYTLHGKLVTHMTVGNDKLHFFYDAQSRPMKVRFNGTIYTYLHNLQGDIVGILDSNGALVVEYRYDAWGRAISITGSFAATLGKRNPFRYRGYVYDTESGLYYLRNRYCNPKTVRFVNADTIMGVEGKLLTHNQYAYCAGNPILFEDRNGHLFGIGFMIGLTTALVGAAVSAGAQIVANAMTGANLLDGVLGAAVGGAVYNLVSVYSYGDTALAAYASAAAESFTNEVVSYTFLAGDEQKELTRENVYDSLGTIATDTMVNGTAYYVTGKIAEKVAPTTATINSRKRKIRTVLATSWGQQMLQQSKKQGLYNFNYNMGKFMFMMTIN